jgi:hypothetical protein
MTPCFHVLQVANHLSLTILKLVVVEYAGNAATCADAQATSTKVKTFWSPALRTSMVASCSMGMTGSATQQHNAPSGEYGGDHQAKP